jgi:uncharacterized protein (TIGR01568 family)
MGKYKFRLSDMVPNAWFYKLRDMSHNRRRNQNYSIREGLARKSFTSPASPQRSSFVLNRASYYYPTAVVQATRSLNYPVNLTRRVDTGIPLETPRKSNRRSHRKHMKVLINSKSPKLVSPCASVRCDYTNDRDENDKYATEDYETCISDNKRETGLVDFIVDTERESSISKKLDNTETSSKVIKLALSPIRTRSDKKFKDNHSIYAENKSPHLKKKKASQSVRPIHRQVVSPRLATKNASKETNFNRDLEKSLAVMKYSSDPQRDFTESIIEMIIANNMRSSIDLEDLLACYLSLNSADYHSVIVKVFKEVWLDLNRLRIIE